MSEKGVIKFNMRVGLGLRKWTRQQIEGYCFRHDLICECYEQKGFLESVLTFKITGPMSSLIRAKDHLDAWFVQLELDNRKANDEA
jgi:hypothetical protein